MRVVLNNPFVQDLMLKRGWEEQDLANKIGVSKVQVYRVIRGQRFPGNEFIAGVVKTFPDAEFNQLFKVV
ncbi:helix-turn-helix transcriptional regulator [Paenibacillus thiaminolyticus]|uniref:helix-turn-helix domain-containing protein n=1 Tax=Paenibacillus thiaminolyticus TaxID=49283 RepID=UPI0011658526|nr:helix-turn-helix transcriptional regulator [Paenibacillus thiaminolyticus]NGP56812.1 helix-turn-helix transcriptional regulator [Paenibacillus thiaminolyticus]